MHLHRANPVPSPGGINPLGRGESSLQPLLHSHAEIHAPCRNGPFSPKAASKLQGSLACTIGFPQGLQLEETVTVCFALCFPLVILAHNLFSRWLLTTELTFS